MKRGGAGEQGSRGAGERGSGGAGERRRDGGSSSPLLPCPPAPLRLI
ncbi:hypothetical protein [Candidatus Promineifilum breve]|nr:hypothetical protein [Candidatus Promineifilum breve]